MPVGTKSRGGTSVVPSVGVIGQSGLAAVDGVATRKGAIRPTMSLHLGGICACIPSLVHVEIASARLVRLPDANRMSIAGDKQ